MNTIHQNSYIFRYYINHVQVCICTYMFYIVHESILLYRYVFEDCALSRFFWNLYSIIFLFLADEPLCRRKIAQHLLPQEHEVSLDVVDTLLVCLHVLLELALSLSSADRQETFISFRKCENGRYCHSMFMLWMPRIREWSNSIEILPVLKQHTELWDQCPEPQKRNARSWTEHHPLRGIWSTSPQVCGSVVSGKRHNIVLKQDSWDAGISADVGRIGISCAQALLL